MKTGIQLIAAERARQITEEGYTQEHDLQHTDGELAAAASVYADSANYHRRLPRYDGKGEELVLIPRDYKWPWNKMSFKPTPNNRIRELQKAGALIAAEIDRLQQSEPAGDLEVGRPSEEDQMIDFASYCITNNINYVTAQTISQWKSSPTAKNNKKLDEGELLHEFVNWFYYANGALSIAEVLEDPDDAIDRFLDYCKGDAT